MKYGASLRAASLCVMMVSLVHASDSLGEANKQHVREFLRDIRQAAFVERDPARIRAVVEQYISADYVQHAASVPPGREGYIQFLEATAKKIPAGTRSNLFEDTHFVGDGNMVVWVSESRPGPAEAGKSDERRTFNMVRFKNGKMVEHWGP